MDFLKGISAQLLPGVQELQRRDLLHRASVVFPIDDKESDIEEELTEDLLILNEQDENGEHQQSSIWVLDPCRCCRSLLLLLH